MKRPNALWFLVWRRPGRKPYATALCAYTRKDLRRIIDNEIGTNWDHHRSRGARMERIDVIPGPTP